MAVFSTNQVRHFYAANAVSATKVTNASAAGTIRPVADAAKKTLYFEYKGATSLMRSDLISTDSIVWAKHSKATDKSQNRPLKKVTVTLDSDVNGGQVISGQDYILRIAIRQFAGMSDEDVYIKHGMVHGTKGMTAEKFYTTLKESLEMNFSRELTKLFNFSASASGLVIEEVEQDWILGTKQQVPVYFDVIPTTVLVDGEEVCWGKAVKSDSATTVPNSKNLADLEYFCMGERGDIYRNVGFPNVIHTKYLINGEDPTGYDILDIHYFYEGGGENPQKSEKDITIVAKSTEMTKLITAFKTATGITPAVTQVSE